MSIKKLPAAQFLRESGLLFKINRDVLHPLGLALAIEQHDDGSLTMSQDLLDYRDEDGVYFDRESVERGEQRLRCFREGRFELGATPGDGNT